MSKRRVSKTVSGTITLMEAFVGCRSNLWRGQAHERAALSSLERSIQTVGPDTPLAEVDKATLLQIVDHWYAQGNSPTTVNKHLSRFNKFLQWYADLGRYPKELPRVPWQNTPEAVRRYMKPHEQEKALEILDRMDNAGQGAAALLRIALKTGMRKGEILKLDKADDLERFEDGEGRVRYRALLRKTKTKNPRTVPLDQDTFELLSKWLPWQETLPSRNPKELIRLRWNKAKKEMGLDDDWHFRIHAARHTAATELVSAGVGIRPIQALLGHKRITTTEQYAHVADEALMDAADVLHQRIDRKKKAS